MALLRVLGVSLVAVWGLAGGLSYLVHVYGGHADSLSTFDTAMAQRYAAEVAGFVALFAALYGVHGALWPSSLPAAAFGASAAAEKGIAAADGAGGLWGRASWRTKWANRVVAGLHGAASSVWALCALRALAAEAAAACAGSGPAAGQGGLLAACGDDGAAWLLPLGLAYDAPRDRHAWWLGGVLEFTLAYSVYDFAYMALLEPGAAFMLHHLAIMSCFAPLFWSDRGYVIAVVGIAVAELANPLLGVWTWAKENLKSNPACRGGGPSLPLRARHAATFARFSLPVTVAYATTRGVAMPLSLLDVAFVRNPTPVLAWVWVHCAFGFLGSMAWIHMLVTGYFKFRSNRLDGGTEKEKGKAQ